MEWRKIMKTKWFTSALVIIIVLLFSAPPSWAKAQGWCFVIGYSYKLKKAFYTPVFMVKVDDVSYSETEYVAEMELFRNIEAQFQDFLLRSQRVKPTKFTIDPKGAYKSQKFAIASLEKEKKGYTRKKFEMVELTGFRFEP